MIRISSHGSDPAFVILRVDRDHNRVIGSFEPARRQDDMGVGVYVMEAAKLDSLKTWARFQNVHLLNEARDKAEPTQALECGNTVTVTARNGDTFEENCCAPYPTGRVPRFCGACGQPAKPVTFQGGEPLVGVTCPGCQRVNHGGPAYCVGCGTPLPEHHLHASALPRLKREPVPVGAVIAELATHPEHAPTARAHAAGGLHDEGDTHD